MSQIEELIQVVARLRSEDGCPWDREQTHDSLKPELIEEACEIIGGINVYNETGNFYNLREELGDLLLQVVMHAQIASENGLFNIEDVAEDIKNKMIRRHPHVFGEIILDENGNEATKWADIKRIEKANSKAIEPDLRRAFSEGEELINKARERKGI